MSTRRPVVPPEAPPVAVPEVSPALHKGTGTRAIGDRLRFWRAGAGLWLCLWQLPPGVAWLLDAPWPLTPAVLWEAAGLGVALAGGLAWVLLTFRQDWLQLRYMQDLWNVELTALERGHATQRRVAAAHARRWYRLSVKSPAAPPEVHHWQQEGRARVGSPVENPPERDTRQLPAPPAPTPYYGTDAYQLVDAALTGQPFGVNSPLGRRLGKARHAAALARLLGAEVLIPPAGKGQGPALAPGFARFRGAPALGHAATAAWLGAPPLVPSPTVPGRDMGETDA